jgi:hypothetical protein
MQLQTPRLAAGAFVAVTVAALAAAGEVSPRDDTLTWTRIAQAEDFEQPGKIEPGIARKERGRRAAKDDDDDDDVDDNGRRSKRVCPPGQRPTPHRGRGGDQGGCI